MTRTRAWLVAVALLLSLLAPLPPAPAPAEAQPSHPNCSSLAPLGAVPPAVPIWCFFPLPSGVSTFRQGANAWVDDWQHGLSNSDLGAGYAHGTVGGAEGVHWRHQDHWMVDLRADTGQFPTLAAAWMRPDRTFTPDPTGRVVIEFEVAVPIAGTREVAALSDSWPEVVLAAGYNGRGPAGQPTGSNPWGSPFRPNGVYLYEAFPHAWAFGCRMQQSRHPICALYRPDTDGVEHFAGGPDRLWEINQNGGDVTDEFGGDPSTPGLADAWASCASADDPDVVCRNTFRMELTASRVRLDVRKPGAPAFVRYYEAGLIDTNLGHVLNAPGGFHVFLGDFAYRIVDDTVLRFHWDRLAVNPHLLGAPVPPTATPTPTASPTGTPVPPTASPTGTPPAVVCEARVRVGGIERWVRKPPAFCEEGV